MALVSLNDLVLRFRDAALLDHVSCRVEPGERVGLLGRNGAGKTSLMRLLTGELQPDGGEVQLAPNARIARLSQEVPQDTHGSVREVVAAGLGPVAGDAESAWQAEHSVDQILSRLQLDGGLRFESLSSGMKRRVLLAQSLVAKPDLLLLDEPTNHLDISAIRQLEDFLQRWSGTLLFVTHDRAFLRKLATRIWELDRGRLFDWSCSYEQFLTRKEAALAAEEKQNALFDKRLAEEEVWIRQGIKARRTRNEGRVRALEAMRRQRSERRSGPGKVQLTIHEAERSGNRVVEAEGIAFSYGDRPVFRDVTTSIYRGDKIGILGPNGAGKTTLLKVLLGKLPPERGTVRLGVKLQIAYFDQLREQLDDDKSVQENVGDGYDTIGLGEQRRHIVSYLQDFLFTPERARTPVSFLSGGERNRVLLARLFAKPANVLVLDEPTNDLDSETLQLLEERLVEFEGTVLMVSHDREFLNNVVTSLLVFEGGDVREYVGGYDDYQKQAEERAEEERQAAEAASRTATAKAAAKQASPAEVPDGRRKLSYKERRELDGLPAKIEQLETEIAELHVVMADPETYRQPKDVIAGHGGRLKQLEDQMAAALARWEELADLEG